ncbi:MAG TPA: gpW family head-tail joining protein [Pseudorhizobium sp.]|nr:gpW family head-tail joining protein [Pseudorhizobium sp.]
MSKVIIDGAEIDIRDNCAILDALLKVRLTLATGGTVSRTRFGEDEVTFTEANGARLDKLIATYEGLCDRSQGRRRRHAMGIQWAP